MSRLGKTIISLVSAGLVAVAGILLYVFWPAITGTINDNKYYTADEVQDSYDKAAEIQAFRQNRPQEDEVIGSVNKEHLGIHSNVRKEETDNRIRTSQPF